VTCHAIAEGDGGSDLRAWPADCTYVSMKSKKKIQRLEDLLVWQKSMDILMGVLTFDVNNVLR
jgi:hypothetical protein